MRILSDIKAHTKIQIHDTSRKTFKHLFATGEVVGGWHGDDRYGGNVV